LTNLSNFWICGLINKWAFTICGLAQLRNLRICERVMSLRICEYVICRLEEYLSAHLCWPSVLRQYVYLQALYQQSYSYKSTGHKTYLEQLARVIRRLCCINTKQHIVPSTPALHTTQANYLEWRRQSDYGLMHVRHSFFKNQMQSCLQQTLGIWKN
jgi:hypothetical protein